MWKRARGPVSHSNAYRLSVVKMINISVSSKNIQSYEAISFRVDKFVLLVIVDWNCNRSRHFTTCFLHSVTEICLRYNSDGVWSIHTTPAVQITTLLSAKGSLFSWFFLALHSTREHINYLAITFLHTLTLFCTPLCVTMKSTYVNHTRTRTDARARTNQWLYTNVCWVYARV